eukprot:gene11386-4553_t
MEKDLSKAIDEKNTKKLRELIDSGLEINKQYSFPVGCENKTYGDKIPWTPLQHASALEDQDMIDFLILNGADFSIIDKTNRNAQDIADFLHKDVDVKKVIKEKEREKIYSMEHLFDIKFNFEQKCKRKIIEVSNNESS